MTIALLGNPNSGKTTLFNQLTKLSQKVGNWAGVTVQKKEGVYHLDKDIKIVDLPGVYSLNPISNDEIITNNYLKTEKPDCIINIIDSSNLERSLTLTIQTLQSTNIPIVLALNMSDELDGHGITLNLDKLSSMIAPSILISAKNKKNIHSLMQLVNETVQKSNSEDTHNCLYKDSLQQKWKNIVIKDYISANIDNFCTKTNSKIRRITDIIDKIILNKWLAFPIFASIIFCMYIVSIQLVGGLLTDTLTTFVEDTIGENFRTWLNELGASIWVSSLFVDGIIAGVGAVLLFLPQIVVLFIFITALEGCGYMARVAVIMDRLFNKIGLSGKSFIPMLIGCGCSVPAIMSAKTVDDEFERRTTVMLVPFIPCSAKLPVFALMAGVFFPHNLFVAPSMYFLGIGIVIAAGYIIKLFNKNRKIDAFVFDLPYYRVPILNNMIIESLSKIKDFALKAAVIIVPMTIVLWFLQSFDWNFAMVDNVENSMLAVIGKSISWLFTPLGFGDWRVAIAIITGFLAKETSIATFGVLFGEVGLESALQGIFLPHAAYAFMAFILLSAPCIAAIAATKKELGNTKWWIVTMLFQTIVGYLVALAIFQICNLWVEHTQITISILAILFIIAIFAISLKLYLSGSKGSGCAGCNGCSSGKKSCDK
ncbi:MAG: ferrous iron transporter B [Firmicutes bacterium]|nr:ferrous iron transporter B [Bacillota bacterium]MCL1953349.1 ferrous iron transporter B [Bacillota bacterium]